MVLNKLIKNKNPKKISILISLLISSSFSKIEIPLWSIYKLNEIYGKIDLKIKGL